MKKRLNYEKKARRRYSFNWLIAIALVAFVVWVMFDPVPENLDIVKSQTLVLPALIK